MYSQRIGYFQSIRYVPLRILTTKIVKEPKRPSSVKTA